MTGKQKSVLEFHKKMGLYTKDRPTLCDDDKIIRLRLDLIQEELNELEDAIRDNDMVEIADALGDLLYVVYGAGCSYGIDLNPIFQEIHRSNMTKEPGYINPETGKQMKGPNYEPPKLGDIIRFQAIEDKESILCAYCNHKGSLHRFDFYGNSRHQCMHENGLGLVHCICGGFKFADAV